jgi:hypothetical protein
MAYTIVAESPGDIVITFTASGGEPHSIPLKSLTVQKSTDISKEYGTGYHQKYAHVQGKIDYEGDFEIGSWWVSSAENPKTWMDLIKENLTWKDVQGLSKEFEIMVNDVGSEYDRSLKEPTQVSSGTIVTYHRCLLKSDSLNIGDVGSTVSTRYSFSAFSRDPA